MYNRGDRKCKNPEEYSPKSEKARVITVKQTKEPWQEMRLKRLIWTDHTGRQGMCVAFDYNRKPLEGFALEVTFSKELYFQISLTAVQGPDCWVTRVNAGWLVRKPNEQSEEEIMSAWTRFVTELMTYFQGILPSMESGQS